MSKAYTKQQKQAKKQQSKGITKLQRSHHERGFKEPNSKIKSYFAILSNGKIEDYDTTAPIFAKQYFEEIASVRGLEVVSVRAYQ